MKPRALDLYCGGGGASMGLYQAGFEVVGVDVAPQPHYPFEFHQADALTFPLEGFDFVWASPPCQFGSECTPIAHRHKHPNLIPQTRARLQAAGMPYIIENVEAVRKHLINPVMLCGTMFGLPIYRHRYFELSFPIAFLAPPCRHDLNPALLDRKLIQVSGQSSQVIDGRRVRKNSVAEKREAMGIDWMTVDEITQAIPPAYSHFLGLQVIAALSRVAA